MMHQEAAVCSGVSQQREFTLKKKQQKSLNGGWRGHKLLPVPSWLDVCSGLQVLEKGAE